MATAIATNTISTAYSVALAPRSSRLKRRFPTSSAARDRVSPGSLAQRTEGREGALGFPQGKLVAVLDAISASVCGGDAVGLAAGVLLGVVAVPIAGALFIGVSGRPCKR